MKKQLNKKGFTLIEVVLVLAIGGLIFLLAFLAFQQVSRNRRDTQRRSDVARMAATYNDVKANSSSTANPSHDQWKGAITSTPGLEIPGGGAYVFPAAATAYANTQATSLLENNVRLVNVSGVYSVCVGLDGGTGSNNRIACSSVE